MKYLEKFEKFNYIRENSSDINNINDNDLEKILGIIDNELSKLSDEDKLEMRENIIEYSKKQGVDLESEENLDNIMSKVKIISDKNKSLSTKLELKNESWYDTVLLQASNTIKWLQMKLGFISTISSIIYMVIQNNKSLDLTHWQIFWIVVSLLIWRLQNVELHKQKMSRKNLGQKPAWYIDN